MVSFFLWFLGLQATLFGLELTPWVQSWFVVPWTNTLATISAGIVKLVAASLAFPAPWKRKLAGLAIGVVAVQGLNIVRVISLFYLGQWNFNVFEWAHLYVWQALIMLDVLIVWLLWVRTLPRVSAEVPETPEAPAIAA